MAKQRDPTHNFIEAAEGRLVLRGLWTVDHAAAIEKELLALGAGQKPDLDLTQVERMDTAGAWLLKKHVLGDSVGTDLPEMQKNLLDFLPASVDAKADVEKQPALIHMFTQLGHVYLNGLSFCYALLSYIGQISACFARNILHPRKFRGPSIVRHIYEAGLQALPIVALLAFLMSMVIAYQASMQLQKFGAVLFTVDLTVISMLREMGVLVTAIMVAGRSGSAFAAEIGVMKLREEVDALRTMGMDPIEVLVLPRVIALLIALPLLAFLANIVGLLGGALMCITMLDIAPDQFLTRAENIATPTMFFVGMIKAPVFAFLIAVIGTYQGMSVSGSAESVGRLTTVAVVQSIFLVILADALFSIVFAQMGI